jgi:hypothetical protein
MDGRTMKIDDRIWLEISGENLDDEPNRVQVSGDTPARVVKELSPVSAFRVGTFIEVFYDNEWQDAQVIDGPRTVKVEVEFKTFSSDEEIKKRGVYGLTSQIYETVSLNVRRD